MNLLLEKLKRKNSPFVSCKLQKTISWKYELIIDYFLVKYFLVTPIES